MCINHKGQNKIGRYWDIYAANECLGTGENQNNWILLPDKDAHKNNWYSLVYAPVYITVFCRLLARARRGDSRWELQEMENNLSVKTARRWTRRWTHLLCLLNNRTLKLRKITRTVGDETLARRPSFPIKLKGKKRSLPSAVETGGSEGWE